MNTRISTLFLSSALILTACTDYYETFEDNYGYGKSSKGYEFDGSTLTDLRDDHSYNVARVGNLYWMMDNVAYKFYRNHVEKDKADCPRPSESTCLKTGFLYPATRLDYVCPNGWRLPSADEWKEFYNSSAFKNYTLNNEVYKGYLDENRSPNEDGESAYFWTDAQTDGGGGRECVVFSKNDDLLRTVGPFQESSKLAVRCVLDAGSAGPEQNIDDVSSLEVNLEEVCAMGLNEQCLVGTWNLNGIESTIDKSKIVDFGFAPSTLVFTEDGKFEFTNTTSPNSDMAGHGCAGEKTYGSWKLEGASLKIIVTMPRCQEPDVGTYTTTPTLTATDLNLNTVVFHSNDISDAFIKSNATEHYIRVYHPTSNITSDSGEFVACQNPAYCYRTTVDSQRYCYLDKEVAEVKVQLAKDEGIFKEYFVDCWDM